MSDPQLRQLLTVLRGCIRGGDHARALRLLITNLPRAGGHHRLRQATAQILQEMGRTQEAVTIYEMLTRHLLHRNQPLQALANACTLTRLTQEVSPQLDYIASLCCAGSPFLDAEAPVAPPLELTEPMDLGGLSPGDPLEALVEKALAQATDPQGLVTAPDVITPIPLLSHLPQEELRQVFARLQLQTYVEGSVLLSPVDPPTATMWVASGKLTARDDNKRTRTVGPGSLLGHQRLLSDQISPPAFTLLADTALEMLALPPGEELPELLLEITRRFDAQCQLDRALHNSPLFSALPREAWARLQQQMQPCQLPAEALLIREGQESTGLFVIVEGQVQVTRHGQEQEDQVLASTLGAGELLGEISLVSGGAAVATVKALRPTRVLYLDKDSALGLLKEHPEVMEQISGTAAERLLK